MIRLSSGDYINPRFLRAVYFDEIEDLKGVKHARANACWDTGLHELFHDSDATILKDYFDKNYGGFFQVHKLDHVVQVIGLGVAVQIIQDLTGNSVEEISQGITDVANRQVAGLTAEQINEICQTYLHDCGKGISATLGRIKLA